MQRLRAQKYREGKKAREKGRLSTVTFSFTKKKSQTLILTFVDIGFKETQPSF
jgi:hypothetical protein